MVVTKKIAIIGSSGYTGQALAKILTKHPNVAIKFSGNSKEADEKFFENISSGDFDLIFFATPNGTACKYAPQLIKKKIHVIDLAADYRFKDLEIYRTWYGFDRNDLETNSEAIYGLVEFKRNEIKNRANKKETMLIANPGCYTTSSILALSPLLKYASVNEGLIDWDSIIIDGKSGVSGAGRKAETRLLYSELNENCSPYNLAGKHRHTPELEMFFGELCSREIKLSFSPHLIPMTYGLLTTCYVNFKEDFNEAKLREIYLEAYKNESFIELLTEDIYPETRLITGTNNAQIQVNYDARTKRAVITCAIDNLIKGAAGQAVQNMNLIFGFGEGCGLATLY
jgi:N-acetyl-gamma-glutamyl-phosphate reductase